VKVFKHPSVKRSFFAAFARFVGIVIGAAAGSWLQRAGGEISNSYLAIGALFVSFGLMWFAEYERVN